MRTFSIAAVEEKSIAKTTSIVFKSTMSQMRAAALIKNVVDALPLIGKTAREKAVNLADSLTTNEALVLMDLDQELHIAAPTIKDLAGLFEIPTEELLEMMANEM